MAEYLTFDCIVIGSGAAGYNAACRLKAFDKKSVAIVTEGVNCGTSRNTGSDKQTYYKLGLGGDSADSVRQMAQNLFDGGSVDGDSALCEAALSSRSFLNLCELGVPFPTNRYGEYVGYKTDHDPFARATSAGPLTSKFMTEALQKQADTLGVQVYSELLAVEILKNENGVCGLFCISVTDGKPFIFKTPNIVLCTGGPAGIYEDRVFPHGHTGSTGLALSAGASLQNMTEWQYGLASVDPEWNVSGTYMQVLPRFVSVDENGTEHEFLLDFFKGDVSAVLSAVFLKGYQWPFDCKKVADGSSVIDLLVYRERAMLGRRVYLDFTKNPFGITNIDFESLIPEAYDYLKRAGACFGTPIMRLEKMNLPAIELYRSKGTDITKDYLEIALCAQHNNGGIAVDLWWQTDIDGLYAAGECAGTHGITRPGGSALNAGQVGSLRAAIHINANTRVQADRFNAVADEAISRYNGFTDSVLKNKNNADSLTGTFRRSMSEAGGAIRNTENMQKCLEDAAGLISHFEDTVGVAQKEDVYKAYKLYDMLITQCAVLTAMLDFSKTVGSSRGSALYTDKNGQLRDGLSELFRLNCDNICKEKIQQVRYSNGSFEVLWRKVRPIPEDDDFFENVWRRFREDGNIY